MKVSLTVFHLHVFFFIYTRSDDTTRVILEAPKSSDSGDGGTDLEGFNDYINASHVVMEVPGSNITNRYIACQGPLNLTCSHFWLMVWQQKCSLLVMLTTCVEQGRLVSQYVVTTSYLQVIEQKLVK